MFAAAATRKRRGRSKVESRNQNSREGIEAACAGLVHQRKPDHVATYGVNQHGHAEYRSPPKEDNPRLAPGPHAPPTGISGASGEGASVHREDCRCHPRRDGDRCQAHRKPYGCGLNVCQQDGFRTDRRVPHKQRLIVRESRLRAGFFLRRATTSGSIWPAPPQPPGLYAMKIISWLMRFFEAWDDRKDPDWERDEEF